LTNPVENRDTGPRRDASTVHHLQRSTEALNDLPARTGASLWIQASILALALGLALAWWWQRGLAISLADVSSAKVPCLSYAPFRRDGANPVRVGADITPAQIEEDLRLVKTLSSCIRTYGVGKGLAAVPAVAAKLGMRVRLGVWLGRDVIANQAEMETALALAQKYRDTIDVLIVGNEVLLREDLDPDALAAHLKDAKARSAVPISYADVWEFWRRQSSLKQYVDIVTIHVLPYWEDEPVTSALASTHVFDTIHDMQKEFAGHPVWLGETGWPAAGRQRAGAVPGLVAQTQVLREVMLRAAQEHVDVNLIEAFDQPWKRHLEGGMGGAWGMFKANGTLRMSFAGPVQEDPHWWRGPLAALVGAALGLVISVRAKRPLENVAGYALVFALIGIVAPAHIDAMVLWSRDANEWLIAVLSVALVLAGTLSMLQELFHAPARLTTRSMAARLAMLFIAALWAWYLWVDPRYRGFPIALFYPAAALSACLFAKTCVGHWQGPKVLVVIALSLSLIYFAIGIIVNEGLENTQALVIATLWILIAFGQLLACYPRPPVKA
jgi:exo-beta-1,3-glucanase (GH17 family)